MWNYVAAGTPENQWGSWYCLVTLSKNGSETSCLVSFPQEPSLQQITAAGERLAADWNRKEAYAVSTSIPREEFLNRFTNQEIANIYAAAQVNSDVFVYVKKMELNPTIHMANPEVLAGLTLLEKAGLLDEGRAVQIMGA